MNTSIKTLSKNLVGNDYIVGDIHGKFKSLENALEAIHFAPEKDRLFAVGDLIDRGSDSIDIFKWIEKPWFYSILGNHEYMAYRWLTNKPIPHVDIMQHGGLWLKSLDHKQKATLINIIEQLPMALEIEVSNGAIGVIHADCPYDDWNQFKQAKLGLEYLTDSWNSDADICIWSRSRYQQQYSQNIRNIKAVIHGHTTLKQPQKLGNVHFIDTTRADGSNFTLLSLSKLK